MRGERTTAFEAQVIISQPLIPLLIYGRVLLGLSVSCHSVFLMSLLSKASPSRCHWCVVWCQEWNRIS